MFHRIISSAIITAHKKGVNNALIIGMVQIVRCSAKITETKPSLVTEQPEKRFVDKLGMEKIAQLIVIQQPDVFIVIKRLV